MISNPNLIRLIGAWNLFSVLVAAGSGGGALLHNELIKQPPKTHSQPIHVHHAHAARMHRLRNAAAPGSSWKLIVRCVSSCCSSKGGAHR